MLMRSAVTAKVAIAANRMTAKNRRRDRPVSGLLAGVFMRTPRKMNQACGGRLRMAHRVMTARALESGRLAVNYIAVDCRGDRFVTSAACILCDLMIKLCDLDRVGIASAGEVKGMPESVVRFDRVFSDEVMRGVAVVTGCGRVMARLHPGVVQRLHYVTVGAGCGIVGEIGIALRIDECIGTQADCDAYNHGRQNEDGAGPLHRRFQPLELGRLHP